MAQRLDENLFQTLVEHSLDAIALIQSDGKVLYVSPAITHVLGYAPNEFCALDPFDVVHPEQRTAARDFFRDILNQPGSSQTVVNQLRHKDGSWKWVEIVSTNQVEVPHIAAIVANFRDITDHRVITKAIREAEEKFRGIVESATEFVIFTTDLDGRVNSWNSGATRLLGYHEAEVIGQDCRIIFTPEDNAADQPEAEMQSALVKGKGNDERWHVRKDGSRFWGSGLMMPLRDDVGNVHGYLKIFRDMTRAKRAEEALMEASRKKDEFLALLAHELRNPLAAISNAALLLAMADDERPLEWAQEVISRQAKYLSRLLDDLLDVSRVTHGKIRLQKERHDLSAIIAKAVEAVRPLIDEKKHRLTVTIAAGEIPIVGDPIRVEQIFVNLLSNAAKYTDPGGRIVVSAKRGHEAVVSVQDSGIGIEPKMLPKILRYLLRQKGHSIAPRAALESGFRSCDRLLICTAGPSSPQVREWVREASLQSVFP